MNVETEIGAIVLAAGASSRLGAPKQLLEFQGRSLLRRAAQTALVSVCRPVVVVLGAGFEETKSAVEDLAVHICFSENWRDGIGRSIKSGLETLLRVSPDAAAVVIALADQPLIKAQNLNDLVAAFGRGASPLVASEYGGTCGVPALFARQFFGELLALEGDEGARKLLKKHPAILRTIPLPEAAFDVDTRRDFENLLSHVAADAAAPPQK